MKKFMRSVLAIMVLLAVSAPPVHADRHGHYRHGGHVGFGIYLGPDWWGPGWGPGWGPYPYYPYYYPPPVVVQPPSDIYVQPAPQRQPSQYWYYCQEPAGYYPYVKACPGGWMKVVPPENPPEGEE